MVRWTAQTHTSIVIWTPYSPLQLYFYKDTHTLDVIFDVTHTHTHIHTLTHTMSVWGEAEVLLKHQRIKLKMKCTFISVLWWNMSDILNDSVNRVVLYKSILLVTLDHCCQLQHLCFPKGSVSASQLNKVACGHPSSIPFSCQRF